MVKSLLTQAVPKPDGYYTTEIQDFLFAAGDGGGIDLVATNIQRGRDHGIQGTFLLEPTSINALRYTCYCEAFRTFPYFPSLCHCFCLRFVWNLCLERSNLQQCQVVALTCNWTLVTFLCLATVLIESPFLESTLIIS